MDGQRFDDLTRLLARGTPRRRVLQGLTGGALGLLGLRAARPALAGEPVCVGPGEACTMDSDCCEGACSDLGICFCENPDQPILGCTCDPTASGNCFETTAICCPTETEGVGVCVSGSVGCDPTGCPGVVCDPTAVLDDECNCVCPGPTVPCGDGQCAHCGAIFQVDPETCECICPGTEGCPCESTDDCADGRTCCPDGYCRTACEGVCQFPGETCLDDDSCCEGSCSDEGICFCDDPSNPVLGCSCVTGTQDACPEGLECCALAGSAPGGPGTCIPVGTECARQECQPAGFACLFDRECCVGTCGEDGFCFCEDPALPALGCPCDPAVAHVCGDDFVCCAADGDAVCVHDSVGCDDGDGGDGDGGGGATTTPVPTLPSTGVGAAGESDGDWLGPVALAGAGAAVVASRLIRRNSPAEAEAEAGES